MQQCNLTFGWLVRCGRENDGLTQKGLCSILKNQYSILFTPEQINAIENDDLVADFQGYVLASLCELFNFDRSWGQQILDQTKSKYCLRFEVLMLFLK